MSYTIDPSKNGSIFALIFSLGPEKISRKCGDSQPGGIKRMLLRPKVKKPNTSLGMTKCWSRVGQNAGKFMEIHGNSIETWLAMSDRITSRFYV